MCDKRYYHAPVSSDGEPPPRPSGVPAWDEAAEDWLAAKRVGRGKGDPGNSDRARRSDLRRWAAAINAVQGRQVPDFPPHSLDGWQYVMTEFGDVDVLLRSLDLLGADLAPSSRQRALSTMRGFCGWLVRRDHLPTNPCDAPEHGEADVVWRGAGVPTRRRRAAARRGGHSPTIERAVGLANTRGRRHRDICPLRRPSERARRPHRRQHRTRPATGAAQGARRRQGRQAPQRPDPRRTLSAI